MKGVLLCKDGRRRPMDDRHVGCQRFHSPIKGPDGRTYETIFEADPDVVDGVIIYRETETREVE